VERFFRILNLCSLLFGALGGLILFYSLTMKPSNFRLIETADRSLAICLDGKRVVAGYGGPLVVSDEPCADLKKNGPTPRVVADRPRFVTLGVQLVVAGFGFQLPAGILAQLAKSTSQDPVKEVSCRPRPR
jgi:hypothetical protein